MAPTEGRVAKPERWWDCRRCTPTDRAIAYSVRQRIAYMLYAVAH